MEDRMVREAGGIHASHTQIYVEYLKVACSKDVTWGTPGCKVFWSQKGTVNPAKTKIGEGGGRQGLLSMERRHHQVNCGN